MKRLSACSDQEQILNASCLLVHAPDFGTSLNSTLMMGSSKYFSVKGKHVIKTQKIFFLCSRHTVF